MLEVNEYYNSYDVRIINQMILAHEEYTFSRVEKKINGTKVYLDTVIFTKNTEPEELGICAMTWFLREFIGVHSNVKMSKKVMEQLRNLFEEYNFPFVEKNIKKTCRGLLKESL